MKDILKAIGFFFLLILVTLCFGFFTGLGAKAVEVLTIPNWIVTVVMYFCFIVYWTLMILANKIINTRSLEKRIEKLEKDYEKTKVLDM